MDPSKLEEELQEYKHKSDTPISPLVRSRLDETYASLPVMSRERKGKVRRFRKTASVAAATIMLGAAVFATGFISPVMAKTIEQIPLVGSLFSLIKTDLGLQTAGDQGLATNVNSSISHQNIKLEVMETVFDGTRAVYLLRVTAPNIKAGMFDTGKEVVTLRDAIENVTFTIDGKGRKDPAGLVAGNVFYPWRSDAPPNVLIFETILKAPTLPSPVDIPDSFQAEVTVKLEGIEQAFKLNVPFKKKTDEIIQLKPNAIRSNAELSLEISEIHMTPVTTRLSYSVKLHDTPSSTFIRVAIFDDQGRELKPLHGDGVVKDNTVTFDWRYAPIQGHSKHLIIKPFVIVNQVDQYLDEMEIKIDLPEPKQ